MARVIEVIETDICRGKGTKEDRCRRVMQYWSRDGELLAERDPCSVIPAPEQEDNDG